MNTLIAITMFIVAGLIASLGVLRWVLSREKDKASVAILQFLISQSERKN